MTASPHPLLLPLQRERAKTSPLSQRAGRPATRQSRSATSFPPSPWDGGHGDAGLSVQLGPVAEGSAQRSHALNVDPRAGFQPAKVRFFPYPVPEPTRGQKVRRGSLDLYLPISHVTAPLQGLQQ